MAPKRSELPRDPRQAGLVRAVRSAHRGYQSYGNTALNLVRAEARDSSTYAVHLELNSLASRIASAGAPHPSASEVRRAKASLLAAYPTDEQLRRDARRTRYNSNGPMSRDDLVLTILAATREFREEIDGTKSMGRRAKRKARAHAWSRLHAVLAGIEFSLLADQHPNIPSLGTVARGCLR